jgi:hypothetical protein
MIHHDGAHANQYIVLQRTTMHQRIMPNAAKITNLSARFLIGAMDDGSILDIHSLADADGVYITTDYRIEPEAAMVARNDIAHKGGIFGDKTIFTKYWRYAFYR